MIKLLAISGSPVDYSSTDILIKEITSSFVATLAGIEEVQTTFIKLNERNIKACQACGEAPIEPKFCLFDGLDDWYKLVAECDCLIFGSPIYFDSVSAQAKLFIDRCNCFRPPDYTNSNPDHLFLKRITNKRPGAIVLVGGEKTWYEGARRVVAGFFKWIEIKNDGMIQYGSPDYTIKGSVVDNKEKMIEAKILGEKLAGLCQNEK